MAACRSLPLLTLALLASGLLTSAGAQMRGMVGGEPTEGLAASAPAPAQGPLLPNLEDEVRAEQARRRAREQQRAVSSAGNPVLDPRTRGQVIRPVRGAIALRRPANRAVPFRAAGRDAAASVATRPLPQTIAPGLSDAQPARRRRPPEEDAYAPLGLRLAGLIVRPGIEASVGYDTNPQRSASTSRPKGSKVYQGAADLSVQSDWTRHQLQLDLRGVYNYYPDAKDADRPTLDGRLTFRGDMGEQGTLNLELRERIDSQRPGSPDLSSDVKGRPLTYQTGATAGYTQRFGPIAMTAAAAVDRYDFQDGVTRSGVSVPQGDREYSQYGLRLRGAYEITPGIAPFIEASADRRVYDQAVDSGGYRRSSHGVTGRLGTSFELTRTLTGEISAGYGVRDYADTRLAALSGALLDASLVWQVSPLTRATLRAGSEFVETTQIGSSGAISRRIGLLVTHDLLRNLQFGASVDYSNADYSGVNRREQTFVAGLRMDYKIDRHFVFRTSYAYERAVSSLPNNSSRAHVFLVGLRMQR